MMRALNQILQNTVSGRESVSSDDPRLAVVAQRAELLEKIHQYLALMDNETDLHMNYYLILNKIRVQDHELRDQKGDPVNPQEIEYEFETLNKEIEANRSKLEVLSLEILNIETNIKSQHTSMIQTSEEDECFHREGEIIENHFKQLRIKFYELEKEEEVKNKYFKELKTLFNHIWKFFKALITYQRKDVQSNYGSAHMDISLTVTDSKVSSPQRPPSSSRMHLVESKNKENIKVSSFDREPRGSSMKKQQEHAVDDSISKISKKNVLKKIINKSVAESNELPTRRSVPATNESITERNSVKITNRSLVTPEKTPTKNNTSINSAKKIAEPSRLYLSHGRDRENKEKSVNRSNASVNIGSITKNNLSRQESLVMINSPEKSGTRDKLQSSRTDLSISQRKEKVDISSIGINSTNCTINHNISHNLSYIIDMERKFREQLENKDKIISMLQEELTNKQQTINNYEDEIIKLNDQIVETRRECETQIASLRNALNLNEKSMQMEKESMNKAVQNLADVCDKNKLKLDEIKNKINNTLDKIKTTATSSMHWVCMAQACTIEELVKQNKDMSDVVKKLILMHGSDIQNDISAPLSTENGITDATQSSHRESKKSIPPQTESERVMTYHTRTEENITESPRQTSDRQITREGTQISDYNDPQHFSLGSKEIKPPTPQLRNPNQSLPRVTETIQESSNTLVTYSITSQTGTHCDTQQTFYPKNPHIHQAAHINTNNPPAHISQDLITPNVNTAQGQMIRMRDFTFKKNAGQNPPDTDRDRIPEQPPLQEKSFEKQTNNFFIAPLNSHQNFDPNHSDPPTTKGAFALNQLTFQKNSFQNSGSMQNLHKILFGCSGDLVSDDRARSNRNYESLDSSRPGDQSASRNQSNIQPPTEYTPIVHKRNSMPTYRYFQHSHSQAVLSNLQESIAKQLVLNSNKKPESILNKVSNHIKSYRNLRNKENVQSGRKSVESKFFSNKKSSESVSPLKASNRSHSAQRSQSPSTARGNLTNRGNQSQRGPSTDTMKRQNSARALIDSSQIYRKPADYKEGERDISPNLRNYMMQKRKIFESPNVANFSDKFDLNSPYHPKFANSYFEGGINSNASKENISKLNLSYISGNASRMSQKTSFLQTHMDQNTSHSRFETKNTSLH